VSLATNKQWPASFVPLLLSFFLSVGWFLEGGGEEEGDGWVCVAVGVPRGEVYVNIKQQQLAR